MNWLASNYKWLFDGAGVTIFLFIVGWLITRKGSESPKSSKVSVDSHDATVQASGPQALTVGQACEIHYYAPAPEPSRSAPVVKLKSDSAKSATSRSQVNPRHSEPTPNLIFLGSRTTTIFGIEPPDELYFFSAKGPGDKLEAIIVGFRNDTMPGPTRIAVPTNTIAQVLYYDCAGAELRSVVRVCWLGRKGDLVDFDLGHDFWLVVALLLDDERWLVPYYKRERDWMGDRLGLENESIDCDQLSAIEVRIISAFDRELFRVHLNFSRDESGNPRLTKRE